MQLIQGAGAQIEHRQQDDLAIAAGRWERMGDICERYEPWQVYDPTTKAHFIVQALRSYPAIFARESHTAWMHRFLYKDRMEAPIQLCFTTCALYSNVTDSNRASVLRVLCQGPSELRQFRETTTPRERLARTQALFLYQIMRLFDGDIALRLHAEKDMVLLAAWLGDLCRIRENLETPRGAADIIETPSPDKDGNVPSSWEWWVFAESVRRTIVIAYAFIGLWQLMRSENDADFLGVWDHPHQWTMSRHLWEAPSSFDFYRLWSDRAHYTVEGFDFEMVLKVAKGDDADQFARLLMVAYTGLDATKQWFADTGSTF